MTNPKGIDDFCAFDGINFRMQVVGLDAHSVEVCCNFFSEFYCKDGDEGAFPLVDSSIYFAEQISHLSACWADLNLRIQQTSRADFHFGDPIDVLHHMVQRFTVWMFLFEIPWACPSTGLRMEQSIGKGLIG